MHAPPTPVEFGRPAHTPGTRIDGRIGVARRRLVGAECIGPVWKRGLGVARGARGGEVRGVLDDCAVDGVLVVRGGRGAGGLGGDERGEDVALWLGE